MMPQFRCCLARDGEWRAFCAEGIVYANDQNYEILLAPNHIPSDEGSLNHKEGVWAPLPEV